MTTKKEQEQSYKREAIVALVVALLGWVVLGLLEPVALWRSIYVMNHTKVEGTKTIATWACVISGIATAVMVLSFLIVISVSVK